VRLDEKSRIVRAVAPQPCTFSDQWEIGVSEVGGGDGGALSMRRYGFV